MRRDGCFEWLGIDVSHPARLRRQNRQKIVNYPRQAFSLYTQRNTPIPPQSSIFPLQYPHHQTVKLSHFTPYPRPPLALSLSGSGSGSGSVRRTQTQFTHSAKCTKQTPVTTALCTMSKRTMQARCNSILYTKQLLKSHNFQCSKLSIFH